MKLTNNDRTVLKSARTMVDEWTTAPEQIKNTIDAIIDGIPINDIDPKVKKDLAKFADRIEELSMEIEADRLEEAVYILKNVLIYGEEPYTD
ncbi:MAG: hypothetical protein H8E70_09020 [Candidatus Marinimicrobia bacterium]|nr:hypothetical protein [Candidatus Neomarinimicrobiota bacterium]